MTRSLLMGFAFALGLVAHAGHAAEVPAKAALCAACHGQDGKTSTDPSFPILAGQHEDYLLHSLKAYRSGARANAIMAAQAQGLSNAEMAELARYYSRLPSPLGIRR